MSVKVQVSGEYQWRENVPWYRRLSASYGGQEFMFEVTSTHCCGMNLARYHQGVGGRFGHWDRLSEEDCRDFIIQVHDLAHQFGAIVWQFPVYQPPCDCDPDWCDCDHEEAPSQRYTADSYSVHEMEFSGVLRALVRGGAHLAPSYVNDNSGNLIQIAITYGVPTYAPFNP